MSNTVLKVDDVAIGDIIRCTPDGAGMLLIPNKLYRVKGIRSERLFVEDLRGRELTVNCFRASRFSKDLIP